MAFDIGNLGDGTAGAKIYQRLKTGAINTYPNNPAQVMAIMLDAVKSRLIYSKYTESTGGSFTDQFQDDDWGTRYYLNGEPTAPVGDITGALDITKYVIDAQKCYKDNLTISAGEVTIIRYSFFHLIILTPETGTSDVLNYLNHDLQPGDLVFFTLSDDTNDTITIQDSSIDDGNFKLQNGQDIILQGPGSCAMFIRDASTAQLAGGKGFLREIGRPDQQAMSIAEKNLSSGGGTYTILDAGTPAAERINTKNGKVILHGNSVTLAGTWSVTGESTASAVSQGTSLEIYLDSPLYTSRALGIALNIFGIDIPDYLCENMSFKVQAWFNDSDADPLNWFWQADLIVLNNMPYEWTEAFDDGTSGSTAPFEPTGAVDLASSAADVRKFSSDSVDTEGYVKFNGGVYFDVDVPADSSVVLGQTSDLKYCAETASVFICPLYKTATSSYGYCMVIVTGGYPTEISVHGISTGISTGDAVYLDGVMYLADYVA